MDECADIPRLLAEHDALSSGTPVAGVTEPVAPMARLQELLPDGELCVQLEQTDQG